MMTLKRFQYPQVNVHSNRRTNAVVAPSAVADGPSSRTVHRRSVSFIIAVVAAFTLLLTPVAHAAQAPDTVSNEPGQDVEVTELDNGDIQVQGDGEVVTVTVDHSTDSARVTYSDGTEKTVDMGGFATLSTTTLDDGDSPTTMAAGSTSCTMIMWAVGLIHSSGWIAAIGIIAGTGPVGATILATMYALGANGFLAWAASKC